MSQVQENRNSYFALLLNLEDDSTEYSLNQLEDKIDLILAGMSTSEICYRFDNVLENQIVYLFKSNKRKRKGELAKLCEKFLPKENTYQISGIRKDDFQHEILQLTKNKHYKMVSKPDVLSEQRAEEFDNKYSGKDLERFKDIKNWYPWQLKVFNHIFNVVKSKDGYNYQSVFKEPHPRHIINIVDKKGNSGKSSFFKYLFYQFPEDIGRLGYGSTSQLKSSVVNIGKKKLYIVDLARSKGKQDSQEDLLAVLEDLKSGLITNPMYGAGKTLLMEPPHIIVSCNYELDYELLSSDRWEVYQIASKDLIKINHKKVALQKK